MRQQIITTNGSVETWWYIGGLFEKRQTGPTYEYRHLIYGADGPIAVRMRNNGGAATYYLTTDHQGSTNAVTAAAATTLVNESFDAFGKRRGSNWTGGVSAPDYTQILASTKHGFTFHEHLTNLNLIHMQGRVFDPVIGRFMSADPYVQAPYFSQSLNRYSYVFNNPLTLVDPSGFEGESTCDAACKDAKQDARNLFAERSAPSRARTLMELQMGQNFYSQNYFGFACGMCRMAWENGLGSQLGIPRSGNTWDLIPGGDTSVADCPTGNCSEGTTPNGPSRHTPGFWGRAGGGNPFRGYDSGPGTAAARAGYGIVSSPEISDTTKRNIAVGGLLLMTGGTALGLVPEALPALALALDVNAMADGMPAGFGPAASAANAIRLEKQLASQAQVGEAGTIMAGAGGRVAFRDGQRVAQQYGGNAADWVKKSSSSYVSRDGSRFETHWVESLSTGQRVEFKTKFPGGD